MNPRNINPRITLLKSIDNLEALMDMRRRILLWSARVDGGIEAVEGVVERFPSVWRTVLRGAAAREYALTDWHTLKHSAALYWIRTDRINSTVWERLQRRGRACRAEYRYITEVLDTLAVAGTIKMREDLRERYRGLVDDCGELVDRKWRIVPPCSHALLVKVLKMTGLPR